MAISEPDTALLNRLRAQRSGLIRALGLNGPRSTVTVLFWLGRPRSSPPDRKGVYHINAVDCVTQWEFVACCERISEAYLRPVIEALLYTLIATILSR